MTVIDYPNLRGILIDNKINSIRFVVADSEYNLPSKSWVLNEFSKSLYSCLKFLNIHDYKPSNNDCDDFSRFAAVLAQILHHRTSPNNNTALAIGEFWYRDEKIGSHAINIIIYLDETPKIMFYEPQTQKEVFLSESEIQSCSFWRF